MASSGCVATGQWICIRGRVCCKGESALQREKCVAKGKISCVREGSVNCVGKVAHKESES